MSDRIKDSDYWIEMSDFERSELEQAIKVSEDESKHVDHAAVMEKYAKWLKK